MALWFRIVQERWAATAMDGEGARIHGGRWNPPGVAAVYLAESRALAALEILVHAPREALALEWRVIPVDVPDEWIETARALPDGWRDQPSSMAARRYGAAWLSKERAVGLVLPSVVVPQERNLLFNPRHPQVPKLKTGKVERFEFDRRL
ncbi:RES family NAD+ phosphorylase [Luteolibacter soli]|uniref:RES domain-containing protein n=1 Tax=Luteolibacter soli TaxID=3135280 RepID=A0ABU9B2N0_9BACT